MSIGLQLFTMMHRFRRMQLAERLGMLPRSEHMILEMLLPCESCGGAGDASLSAACMARRLHISPPAVSRTVRSLRARGLIDAETDPDDRRNTRIRLTPAGHAVLQTDRGRMDALLEQAAARLTPGELDRFFETFDRLCTAVSEELDALDSNRKP